MPSGPRSPEPFATFDRGSWSWRTCRESLPLENLDEPSVTWPASGMTRRGAAYELPTSAPPTAANGCSSSLLPTPMAERSGYQRSQSPGAAVRPSLDSITDLLPTPQARDGGATSRSLSASTAALRYEQGKRNLDDAIALLPTPRATDGEKGGPNQRGSSGDLMLPSAVLLLPTPIARDGSGRGYPGPNYEGTGGRPLDETIYSLASGVPTRRRSPAGRPSSAGPHQPPLWSDNEADDSSAPGSWSG